MAAGYQPVDTDVTVLGGANCVTDTGGGAPACGVTVFEAADGALVPTPFVAVTVNVYWWPFVTASVAAVPSYHRRSVGAGLWSCGVTVVRRDRAAAVGGRGSQLTAALPSPAAATTPVGGRGGGARRARGRAAEVAGHRDDEDPVVAAHVALEDEPRAVRRVRAFVAVGAARSSSAASRRCRPRSRSSPGRSQTCWSCT